MISDSTRHAWNLLTQKLAIGKKVTLDAHDLQWLLEIGAGAVKWHEEHGRAVPELRVGADKPKRARKKARDE